MTHLVVVARVLLTLLLALFAISFLTGILRPETGAAEKAVLGALVAACLVAAAALSALATALEQRLQRR